MVKMCVHTNTHTHTRCAGRTAGVLRIKRDRLYTLNLTPLHSVAVPNRDPKDTPHKDAEWQEEREKRGSKRKTEWHLVKEETACLYYFLLPGS